MLCTGNASAAFCSHKSKSIGEQYCKYEIIVAVVWVLCACGQLGIGTPRSPPGEFLCVGTKDRKILSLYRIILLFLLCDPSSDGVSDPSPTGGGVGAPGMPPQCLSAIPILLEVPGPGDQQPHWCPARWWARRWGGVGTGPGPGHTHGLG